MTQSLATIATAGESPFRPAAGIAATAPDISGLFPDGVLTACEVRENWSDVLLPLEARQLGDVCDKRRAEYAAGRNCARRLLVALHGDLVPLLTGAYRQPLWPEGFVGSISHADDICAVALAKTDEIESLGIDVELLEPLDDAVTDLVLTPAEQRAIRDEESWVAKLIFSIKESNYKCCYHRVRAFIDFQQCEVQLNMRDQSFTSVIACTSYQGEQLQIRTEGRWLIEVGHIFTSAVYRRST
jgi:4'-phosphopantetheinyl transferase EntD